jgi:FdhE protein
MAGTTPRFAENYKPGLHGSQCEDAGSHNKILFLGKVACGNSKPHNRLVAKTVWQQRIRRAEQLVGKHPFAAEILGFYVHLAGFQESLFLREEGAARRSALSFASPLAPDQVMPDFPAFLKMVEENGPELVGKVAQDLRSAPASWSDLLNSCWSTVGEPPTNPEGFLAFAFLQPYAELARSSAHLQLEGYNLSVCPLCNRKPAAGVMRQQGDGARRSLLCGFCLTEWEFRRVVCPGCGQQDHAKLPVYTAESFPYIRVECCDSCQTYIKSIDLTKNGLADPLVDELASIPLDLWAQEHGYTKLHPNFLGM